MAQCGERLTVLLQWISPPAVTGFIQRSSSAMMAFKQYMRMSVCGLREGEGPFLFIRS